MRVRSPLTSRLLGYYSCCLVLSGQVYALQASEDACVRERVRELHSCTGQQSVTTSACSIYEDDVRVGRIVWPGMKIMVGERDPLWVAVRNPQGTWDASILIVDGECEATKVRSVADLTPILPDAAWKLTSQSLLDLSKAIVGVAQLQRAVENLLAEDVDSPSVVNDLSTYGCEIAEDFAPKELSRGDLEGQLRKLLLDHPVIETSCSSASVRLLCRFTDLGGSIQEATISLRAGGGADVRFRKTGLKLRDGKVLQDDDIFRLR